MLPGNLHRKFAFLPILLSFVTLGLLHRPDLAGIAWGFYHTFIILSYYGLRNLIQRLSFREHILVDLLGRLGTVIAICLSSLFLHFSSFEELVLFLSEQVR